jgi:hypothetical protein
MSKPNDRPLPTLVPLPACKDVFGFSRSFVYREAAAGRLELRKIGARTLIVTSSALALIDALPVMLPRPDASRQGGAQ